MTLLACQNKQTRNGKRIREQGRCCWMTVRAYVRVHRFVYLGGRAVACKKCHICKHRKPFVLSSRMCSWSQIKSCILSVFPCGLLHSTRPDCNTLFCLLPLSASLEPKLCLIFLFYLQFKMYFVDRWEMRPAAVFFVFIACARTCSLNPFHILHSVSCRAPPTRNKSISSSSSIFFRLRRGPASRKVTQVCGPSLTDGRHPSQVAGTDSCLPAAGQEQWMDGNEMARREPISPPDSRHRSAISDVAEAPAGL